MIDKKNRMQDQMPDKQDETTGEIRGLRTDLKDYIDGRFHKDRDRSRRGEDDA